VECPFDAAQRGARRSRVDERSIERAFDFFFI